MSIDTTTTATQSGSDRSVYENALWAALTTTPATTAELAAASVPKSTARKILSAWAADQIVLRVPAEPGDPRAAVRWMLPDQPDPETDSPATETDAQPTPAEPAPADNTPTPEPVIEPAPTPEAQPDAPVAPATPDPQAPTTAAAADAVEPVAGHADGGAASDTAPPQPAPAAVVEGVCPTCGRAVPKHRGLQPGALRGLVEDFLREHPGQEFTPGQIAKELNRSSGAVYNALYVLAGKFVAEHTCDRPNKFKLHPSQEQQ